LYLSLEFGKLLLISSQGTFPGKCDTSRFLKKIEEKKTKTKKFITIVTLLTLSITLTLFALPITSAHKPAWEITSYAYIVAAPTIAGANQTVSVIMWVDLPLPQASLDNDIRRHNYTLTITAPDDTEETKHWDVIQDPTGVQFAQFTPKQVGTYTLRLDYPNQTYTWSSSKNEKTWTNDIFLADSATTTVIVQEEPIPEPIGTYPLPTEYWTRPIEGQNSIWYTISSNWLSGAQIQNEPYGRYQFDGIAPNSAHVLWTRPIKMGGVVGGSNVGPTDGEMFYTGENYDVITENPIIMYGRLYHQLPLGPASGGGGYICVDLKTGEEIWWKDIPNQSFGQIVDYSDPNQHGALSGILWQTGRGGGGEWIGTDAWTGTMIVNMSDVPRGTMVYGPNGEILMYELGSNWISLWNTTVALDNLAPGRRGSYPLEVNASSAYSWNITVSDMPSGSWSIETAFTNDLVLCRQGNLGERGEWLGANMTAISINEQDSGRVLWTKHYPAPAGNATRQLATVDPISRVFVFRDKETLNLYGYDLDTGSKIWGPVKISESGWDYFHASQYTYGAYGNLYTGSMTGVLQCFDIMTGDLKWTFGNGGSGNSTFSGFQTPFGNYPIMIGAIADGKIYTFCFEHTADSPIYKGYSVRCINATDGTQLWDMDSFLTAGGGGQRGILGPSIAIADGCLAYLNGYDMQFYCVGKGPSATSVSAPDLAIEYGKSLVIRGNVIDVSAGTKQDEQMARFPNGVPVVSDESMTAWMEYVYMQKPRPTEVKGIDVTISVLDSNGNFREIGKATTNGDGFYSLQWQPDIPGKYTVYASFAGSESYWPSHSYTAFAVDALPEATPPPTPSPAPMTDTYVLGIGSGAIIAIVVIGLVIILMLRKR